MVVVSQMCCDVKSLRLSYYCDVKSPHFAIWASKVQCEVHRNRTICCTWQLQMLWQIVCRVKIWILSFQKPKTSRVMTCLGECYHRLMQCPPPSKRSCGNVAGTPGHPKPHHPRGTAAGSMKRARNKAGIQLGCSQGFLPFFGITTQSEKAKMAFKFWTSSGCIFSLRPSEILNLRIHLPKG